MAETERIHWSRHGTTALLAALAGLLVLQGAGELRRAKLVDAGEVAPPLSGKTLEGASFELSALRGQAVILSFWTTWCPSCQREMPVLVSLAKEYRERGMVVVAANPISQDPEEAVVGVTISGLAPDRPDNVQVIRASDETLDDYSAHSFPTTYVLSREGRVVESFRGLASESSLRDAVERALRR